MPAADPVEVEYPGERLLIARRRGVGNGGGVDVSEGAGGRGPVDAGRAGEEAVREQYGDIGPKSRIRINGRLRIADGKTRWTISEIKNVARQGLTRQIRDYLDYVKQHPGVHFDLYIRQGADLSGPLERAIRNPANRIRLYRFHL